MRLGGPIFTKFDSPEQWAQAVKEAGYSAAYCPVDLDASISSIEAYAKAAEEEDIVIAEVGAWSNPLSPDPTVRSRALDQCAKSLFTADTIGARCCVNIAGSCGEQWDGHHQANLTDATFAKIVETVQEIIDRVNPKQAAYTLEPMPWMYPDSADSYLALIRAVDRPQFGVHLDPINLVVSPQIYYHTQELLEECFAKLGPYMKSCHAKDIRLAQDLTVHLSEVRPGQGNFDYHTYLRLLAELEADTPLMLEHLPNETEYTLGRQYVLSVAQELGLEFV